MQVESISLGDVESEVFDPELSMKLTVAVERDSTVELTDLLTVSGTDESDASMHANRLLTESSDESTKSEISCCCRQRPPQTPRERRGFRRLIHLAIFHRAVGVFDLLVRTLSPSQLLSSDSDGSCLLHTLAKARLLNAVQHPQDVDAFEDFVIARLESVTVDSVDSVVQEGENPPQNVLQRLCLMENRETLRPLEFAIDIGAFETFKKLSDIAGYVREKKYSVGADVYTKYNLGEYDPVLGSRRDRNPLLLLTMMDTKQTHNLLQSGLITSGLVVAWESELVRSMSTVTNFRILFLISSLISVSPLSIVLEMIVIMAQRSYELQKGFYEYSQFLMSAFNTTDPNFDNETAVAAACTPQSVIDYLRNGDGNSTQLKTSPFFFLMGVTRSTVVNAGALSITNFYVLVCSLALLLAFDIVWRVGKRKQRWRQPDREFFINNNFYFSMQCGSVLLAILHLIGFNIVPLLLNCEDQTMGRSQTNLPLAFAAELTETAAVLQMLCNLMCLMEFLEASNPHVAFLVICFRKMCTKFLYALPLLLMTAYLVFGTLMYMTDFEEQEFKGWTSVYYSPLRVLLNMASAGSSRLSGILLHTLFVLVVSINVQNFLIAYVSNEFNEIADNFDLVYRLTRLSRLMSACQAYSSLLRRMRRKYRDRAKSTRLGVVEMQRTRSVKIS